jgi:chromosome segregation ATPase
MKNASKAMVVVMVLSPLALWGCAQNKNSANHNRIHDLEVRNAKLLEDYRGAVASNADLKGKLALAETQRAELAEQVAQLQQIAKERDELLKQVAARTSERDAFQGHLVQFSKDLQSLAGRIEAAAGTGSQPHLATTASQPQAEKTQEVGNP